MQNISMSDTELLKFAIEHGMIDTALVQEKIGMQRREELLNKHPYKIWEDNDGIWHTYLPDNTKKRVHRKRKTREEIEDVIIEYWKEQEENPTVEDVFNEWVKAKLAHEDISKATYDRYNRQFEQCFSSFGKRKIRTVTVGDVEDFILDAIHDCKLTQKGYSNLRTLLFGIFRYAKRNNLISFSIKETISDIEISKKRFRKVEKSDDEQVFTVDELPQAIEYLETNPDIINLGLLLMFKTGLRVGELAALKEEDCTGTIIHIHRTEISYRNNNEMVYEVRNFPKTNAGIRNVVIPDNYAWILKKVKRLNPFGEYLFERDGERIRTYVFRNRMYTLCKKINAKRKSPHKVRKTYGTILIDSNVPESIVISQMGHTDIKTTKGHYYKNRRNTSQIRNEINKVSGLAN